VVSRRRSLLAATAGASLIAAWPLRPSAQTSERKRVAILAGRPADQDPGKEKAYKAEVASAYAPLGFRDGVNLEIGWFEYPGESAWGTTIPDASRRAVAFRPHCIRVIGDIPLQYLLRESGSIPVVAAVEGDPVAMGLAATLSRPGKSVTGIHGGEREVSIKRVQLLKTLAPRSECMAWISFAPHLVRYPAFERAVTEAGRRARNLEIPHSRELGKDESLEAFRRELAKLAAEGCTALHLHTAVPEYIDVVAAVARERKLAVSYAWDVERWRQEGILFLYSARTRSFGADLNRRTAAQVARILRGERPGDIAFEGPLGYYLFVNARTASRIGVTIPADVRLQADEVEA
jgi:putative ABC transport system substrate-binding protein